MLLENILPHPRLSEYIRLFRIVDFVFDGKQALPVKAYPPRPQECLQFYPKDPETISYNNSNLIYSGKKSALIGQHTVVSNRHIGQNFITLQVVFQPGALFRLMGIPSKEFTNLFIDAEEVLGKEVNFINEQLYQATNYVQMQHIVEQYLYNLILQSKQHTHSIDQVAQLMLTSVHTSIDYFSKQACVCHRQFDRVFKERIGIGPKLYMRLIRFDRAFRMKNLYPHKDWATIAIDSGYYDYQHLVKDYKEFTGLAPTDFIKLEEQAPERSFGFIEK
jgi:AraC-like DNA-binding protein